MPSNSTGKWVERAATTGGGRTYRGQMPVNWYATLVVICIVGLALVGFSRYENTHRTASSSGPPTTSQVWHAALGIDVCGTIEPDLPASTNTSTVGLTADGNGVLTIAPKNSSETGANATLGTFVSGYKGLELNQTTLKYPNKTLYTNGDVCPKGTPDSGKPGVVIVDTWSSPESNGKGSETSGDPQDLLFANGQMITAAFVPATANVPKPPALAITALLEALESSTTPTTGATTPATAVTPSTTAVTPSTTAASPSTTTKSSGGSKK
jgi:hypothetical protein